MSIWHNKFIASFYYQKTKGYDERMVLPRLTINKKDVLDTIILYLLLCQVMFLKWMGLENVVNIIIVLLIVLSFLMYYRSFFRSAVFIGVLLLIVYSTVNYLILGGTVLNLLRNLWRYFRGLIILLYFCNMLTKKRQFILTFFSKNLWLFNLYMIINIPILLLQLSGYYSLSSLAFSTATGIHSFDYISGLFGLYATPSLALYSTFLFFFNYYHIDKMNKNSMERIAFSIYNYSILLFNMWLSTQNDNKGFFIIFPIYLIVVYIYRQLSNRYKNQQQGRSYHHGYYGRLLFLLIAVGFCIVIAYMTIEPFRDIVSLTVQKLIEGLNYDSVNGSGERIGMILFLLSTPSKWGFGYGLGRYLIRESALGFSHFAQADFGPLLCLGGFIQIILLFFTVYMGIRKVFVNRTERLTILTLYVILAIYTQIFANTSCTICSLFLLVTIIMFSTQEDDEKIISEQDLTVNENFNH